MIQPGQVEIRGNTAVITTDNVTHNVDITNPESPTLVSTHFVCPVPGCTHTTASINALGPHIAMHRRNGDPGTPPPKHPSKSKKAKNLDPAVHGSMARSQAAAAPKPKVPKPKPKLAPSDVADGVLAVLYPGAIPVARFRDVAAWVAATDRLAVQALADQVDDEPQ